MIFLSCQSALETLLGSKQACIQIIIALQKMVLLVSQEPIFIDFLVVFNFVCLAKLIIIEHHEESGHGLTPDRNKFPL